jgi:hypothetical protein
MARRDDILRRKQAYEDAKNQQDTEVSQYRQANRDIMQNLNDLIRSKIGETSLNLSIDTDRSWRSGVEVRINNGSNPHDEQALNWDWRATMTDEGDIKKESGSWSGLSATTPEQIANLKESVRVIEILNNLDWNELLTVEFPNFDDYVKTEVPERENFEKQLLEADVEDAAEQGLLIKGHGYKWYAPRATVFYNVLNMTDKSFRVQEVYEDDLSDESRWGSPYTIRKDKFFEVIDKPIKTAVV